MAHTIGIDYTAALQQGGGIGRYTRELVRALAALDDQSTYRLFAAGHTPDSLPDSPGPNFTLHPSRLDSEWLARLWHRARLPLPIEGWLGPLDLLHAPDFSLPPARRGTSTILTVHDLSFIRTPETATPGLRAYLNRVVPRSVARADLILADSQSTRQDLIDLYDTPADKIHVLYCGVDAHFRPVDQAAQQAIRARYGLDSPYILSVGTVQPRKNYGRLAEALTHLLHDEVKLVIVGGKGWLDDALYQQIETLNLQDRVIFPGFVPDDDLPALYAAAEVFALPSLYEGFGLPVLEAMACQTAVVTSDRSSLPEVAGEAALLVDPYDVEAIAAALTRLLDDTTLRQGLIDKGRAHIEPFTWRQAAHELLTHYHTLIG